MKQYSLAEDSDFYNSIYERISYDSPRVILSNGNVITRSDQTERYNFLDYYTDHCLHSYINEIKKPIIVCAADGSLFNLENIRYDNETIDYLNQEGIDIFLWEILHLYRGEKRKVSVFNEEDLKFLYSVYPSYISEDEYSAFELDSVQEFIFNNNLKTARVYTFEYNTKQFFKKRYPELELNSMNTVVITIDNKFTKIENVSSSIVDIDKKFICLNLRYDFHRQIVASYLSNMSSIISWHNNSYYPNELFPKPCLKYLNDHIPFNIEEWQEKNPDQYFNIVEGNRLLADNFPIFLDEEHYLENLNCGSSIQIPKDSYYRSFCSVVNESNFFTPFGGFSEKTLNSIFCYRPFILVGPPRSLEYIQKYGFKTFDRWWDESYDQEEDHEKRMVKILKVIDYIDSFSIDELKSMYVEMKDVLEYNFKVLKLIKHNNIIL